MTPSCQPCILARGVSAKRFLSTANPLPTARNTIAKLVLYTPIYRERAKEAPAKPAPKKPAVPAETAQERVARMQRTIAAWAHVLHYGQAEDFPGGDGVDYLFRALADANDALAEPWLVEPACEDADFSNLLLSVGRQMRAANVTSCAGLVARFGCDAPLPVESHQVKQDSGHVSRLTGADMCHISCGLCSGRSSAIAQSGEDE